MTYRIRKSALSPKNFPISSSTDAPKRRRRRNIPKQRIYDDYTDGSASKSPYPSEEEDDEELIGQPMNADDDASYTQPESESESEANSPLPESIPETNNFEPKVPSFNSSSKSHNLPIEHPIAQSAAYINVAPLPLFRGGPTECPITHLSRFAKVCRANNAASVDMMMRIFPVTLDGEAFLWYDLNIDPYPSLIWEEIKSSFLEAYGKNDLVSDEQFRSELMIISQGNEESVRSYFLRLQWVLKRWPDHGLSDGLLRGIFIDGLREDFRNWILPQKPSSLNDALRLAFNWEQVASVRGDGGKGLRCGFCDGRHEERGCEVRERMRGLWIRSREKQWGALWPGDGVDDDGAEESLPAGGGSSVAGREEAGGEKGGGTGEGRKKS